MSSHGLLLALLVTVSILGCGDDDESGGSAGAGDASAPAPNSDFGDQMATDQSGTSIRITFADTELTGRLDDNAAARDLAAQLPLTLTFRDHNGVEKTAPLPRRLSLGDAPEGHDPSAGEIGYWAPDGDLVLYYESDAPFFNGIVRIGEFDGDMGAIERQSQDFRATIEQAD